MKIFHILTLVISLILFRGPLSAAGKVYILCYHAFLESSNSYCFSMDELKSQMETLKMQGVNFISFEDLAAGRIGSGTNVLVTVDDGNHTMYRAWKEVFRPMGIRPVIAIYPAVIGRKKYAMTWNQLKELSAGGCTIASHGWNHLYINKIPETAQQERNYIREIRRSREVLSEKLGRPVDLFVYPYGGVNDYAVGRLRAEGYRWALGLGNREFASPASTGGMYRIPRYLMTRRNCDKLIARIAGVSPAMLAGRDNTPGRHGFPVSTRPSGALYAASVKERGPGRSEGTDRNVSTPVRPGKNDRDGSKEKVNSHRDSAGGRKEADPPAQIRTAEASVVPSVPLREPGFGVFCRNVFRRADMISDSCLLYVRHRLFPETEKEEEKETVNPR